MAQDWRNMTPSYEETSANWRYAGGHSVNGRRREPTLTYRGLSPAGIPVRKGGEDVKPDKEPTNKRWLRKLLRGEPHQVIGLDDPYLLRWYLIPRNPLLNIYLHKFCRSDDDRALHDHPWAFVSLILKGQYWEHREGRPISVKSLRTAGSIAFRGPTDLHRVELDVENGREKPVWTIVVTGPRVREWGFLCPSGWLHWREFVHRNGCGEV